MKSLHESIHQVINETDSLWLSRMQNQQGPRQINSRTTPYGAPQPYSQQPYGRPYGRKPAIAPPAMGRASPAEQMMNRSLNDTAYGRLPPQLRGRVGRRATPYSYDNLNSSPRYGFRGTVDPNTNSNSQYGQNYANWLNQGMGNGDQIARFLNQQ